MTHDMLCMRVIWLIWVLKDEEVDVTKYRTVVNLKALSIRSLLDDWMLLLC